MQEKWSDSRCLQGSRAGALENSAPLRFCIFYFFYEFVIGKTEENAGSNLFHVSFIITEKNVLYSNPKFHSFFYFITLLLDILATVCEFSGDIQMMKCRQIMVIDSFFFF